MHYLLQIFVDSKNRQNPQKFCKLSHAQYVATLNDISVDVIWCIYAYIKVQFSKLTS